MDWNELDATINEFEQLANAQFQAAHRARPGTLSWHSIWVKARDIQEAFKGHPKYPSKSQRDQAWERFNRLRGELSELANVGQKELARGAAELDAQIDDLERLISDRKSLLKFGTGLQILKRPPPSLNLFPAERQDWRPVWEKAREIQAVFSEGIRYPTKSERDAAWLRFNNLRNEAMAIAGKEREDFFQISAGWRDTVIYKAESARYVHIPILDELFFMNVTPEEMKKLAEVLNEAGRILSENKEYMTKEDKDLCFARIQDVRRSHDIFWSQYNEARQIRKQKYLERRAEIAARIEANLAKNSDALERAEGALSRTEENIEKLNGMLDSARGDEFRERVEGWLAEAEARRESILESIRRSEQWVAQDRERLRDLR